MANGNFFSELKRRNVYRVGAAYAVAAFVLIEVVSNVAPVFDLPSWIARAVILLLILGFPAVICFAWVYEITPEGLKRTAEVEEGVSVTHQTGHRLNIVIIGLFVTLAGVYGVERFLLTDETADGAVRTSIGAPAKQTRPEGISIAVLPFVNLSSDPEQEFFSDGMTEEITSALAKVQSLRVVGRTSAFEFKGQNKDLRAIGQALGATHLLEGSVRKSGNRVRITGQLIRADDGTHLWTENYDRELTDIFATQDDIAKSIAGALQVPLGLKAGETLVANRNISSENYQQYLRAKALYRTRGDISRDSELEAVRLLEPVVVAEPGYAPAWALLAAAYHRSPQNSVIFREGRTDQYDELRAIRDIAAAKARVAAQRAIDLDPRNADAYAALGLAQPREKVLQVEDLLKQALELEPSNPDVLHDYSLVLAEVGRVKEAVVLRQRLLSIEPLVPIFNLNTAMILWLGGQHEAAIALLKALPPTIQNHANSLAAVYASLGRFAEAADTIVAAPAGVFRPGEAAAAARLLHVAPAKVPPQDLPDLQRRLSFVYFYVGALERLPVPFDNEAGVRYFWLSPTSAPMRKTEVFKEAARKAGLVEYWRARGWPDVCRPVGADDFECN